ncbi:hypothetical protein WISP_87617 [Willisornis vidua]|uniref:Uncharacterized protein n=1 Tax=Willisornis vidua TaxID=1566151 RepID=A0ABQ9D8D8_9PASS|nr:hypothetical protein WISP_87617 [Willisornis vidua]
MVPLQRDRQAISTQMNSVSPSVFVVPNEEGKLEAEKLPRVLESRCNSLSLGSLPKPGQAGREAASDGETGAETGTPKCRNQENSRGEEKRSGSARSSSSSSSNEEQEKKRLPSSAAHTHTTPAFHRAKNGKNVPKNKRDNLPSPKPTRRKP